MPELKFSAADTSLAMDEVQRKLGPDALILSTERRDGLIEITATNDPDRVEAANLQVLEMRKARRDVNSAPRVEIGSSNHSFSKIIDVEVKKYNAVSNPVDADFSQVSAEPVADAALKLFNRADIAPEFTRIAAELQSLFDSALSIAPIESYSLATDSKMKMLGFSGKTINKLWRVEPSIEMPDVIKKFTRTIVQGKNKDFDASQIILVCGPKNSGKTTLSKKLANFLPAFSDALPNRVIADPLTGDLASLFKSGLDANITSLFRKSQDVNLSNGRLIIDYEGSIDVLNSVLLKLDGLGQKPNVSVVYTLEVGKSYNAVQDALEKAQIPNLFIALTKMDLLEVSISELSAIADWEKKILFFSGLKVLEDGLDFAKVSVVESFLTNLSRQEGW